jgi:hypothetical protein
MPTDCIPGLFGFAAVEGREVVAGFDVIGLVDRFAACFHDYRCQELIEHEVATLVGQRVFGIALGYEDLNDHDQLRHDPIMAVPAGKLQARRDDCAPVAGSRRSTGWS